MRLPIVVVEGGSPRVFQSVDEARRAVEAIDVKEGVHRFFDCEGRRLRASVRPGHGLLKSILNVETVEFEDDSTAGAGTEELRTEIIAYLENFDTNGRNLDEQPLDALIALLQAVQDE